MGSQSFDTWFERATGHAPYEHQRELAVADRLPSVLKLPTGSGKTQSLIGSWLFQREEGRAPRRLVYALPMRSLVEQTAEVASDMLQRLGLDDAIPVHILMGGTSPEQDWRRDPNATQILIGTIDMLISRALNRGYAESRFAWPVSFGLLNSDCRWVFDEVQLMGPARATSAQLDGLRAKLGTCLPCETIWVSATVDESALRTVDRPELGEVMALPDADRAGALEKRLEANKVLERVEMTAMKSTKRLSAVAQLAHERHVPGTRTLVVLNKVADAQQTFSALRRLTADEGDPAIVLLHSRFRPPDRAENMKLALAPPTDAGTIVVATQVVEAGVDTSARTLITELAPFSSIVQRLGRCNREGDGSGHVLWLDTGDVADDAKGRKSAAPYAPADIRGTRARLLELEGFSLSPTALDGMEPVPETADDVAVLRRRDLLDLFDTSPDLSGTDVDIAPFVREDDDRSVRVFFRDLQKSPPARIDDEPAPQPSELTTVPIADLRGRECWRPDHVDGVWLRAPDGKVPPGATVMLNALDGGYDDTLGWQPTKKGRVEPVATAHDLDEAIDQAVEGLASDRGAVGTQPQELSTHLEEVASETAEMATDLGLSEWLEALRAAAALHDVGKAHPAFQEMLLSAMDGDVDSPAAERLWAKSGTRGGTCPRRFFRHELVSALAMASLDGPASIPEPRLTRYLVAAHHGKVRLSIRPAPGEQRPADGTDGARFALGVVDGDHLPSVETPLGTLPATNVDLSPMDLGADDSWTDSALALRDDPALGPFRLSFLEAVLRVADWRASA